jgi:hypothetical protein
MISPQDHAPWPSNGGCLINFNASKTSRNRFAARFRKLLAFFLGLVIFVVPPARQTGHYLDHADECTWTSTPVWCRIEEARGDKQIEAIQLQDSHSLAGDSLQFVYYCGADAEISRDTDAQRQNDVTNTSTNRCDPTFPSFLNSAPPPPPLLRKRPPHEGGAPFLALRSSSHMGSFGDISSRFLPWLRLQVVRGSRQQASTGRLLAFDFTPSWLVLG